MLPSLCHLPFRDTRFVQRWPFTSGSAAFAWVRHVVAVVDFSDASVNSSRPNTAVDSDSFVPTCCTSFAKVSNAVVVGIIQHAVSAFGGRSLLAPAAAAASSGRFTYRLRFVTFRSGTLALLVLWADPLLRAALRSPGADMS